MATAFGTAAAAYDPTLVSVGALDAELAKTVNGSARSTSFFQVMGTAPDTGASIVSGDFPAPTVEQISAGAVTELVNLSTSSSSGSLANQYPGCDTPDIVLANGQRWAACNVGATATVTAYADNVYSTQPNAIGKFFQWGENVAWDYSSGVGTANNCTWNRDTQTCTTSDLSAWPTTVSDTTSG